MRHQSNFENNFILNEKEQEAYTKSIILKRYEEKVQEAKELKELYLACKKSVRLNGETEKANTASVKYLKAEAIRVWSEAEDLLKKQR